MGLPIGSQLVTNIAAPARCSAADQDRAAARIAAAAHKVAAERSIVARTAARIGAAGLVRPGVDSGVEAAAAPGAANIEVDTAAAGLLGSGAGSGARPAVAHTVVARNYFETAPVHLAALEHQGARSGMGMVLQLGRMPCQDSAAAHSPPLQKPARALKRLRRRSVSTRSFYSERETCERSLGGAFDSGGGKAALRRKHADSFRNSWFLSVHSVPLKLPSSGPSETYGAETNGESDSPGGGLDSKTRSVKISFVVGKN